jgi:hypothetical protein
MSPAATMKMMTIPGTCKQVTDENTIRLLKSYFLHLSPHFCSCQNRIQIQHGQGISCSSPTLLQIASFASLEDSHRLQILNQAGQKEEIGHFCCVLL